jgi:hypothetical protein
MPSLSIFRAMLMVAWYIFSFRNSSLRIAATSLETVSDVAGVAAVFSPLIPVNMELLTAVQAFEMIDRLSLHLVEMAVPPGVAAFVTAKAFFLLLLNLPDGLSAVLTAGRFACKCQGRFDRKVAANIIPAAEGFYSVQRYANGFGDFPVSVSVRAEFYDLCFLMIGHHFSAPSKGAVLLYLPHWLPKNSTPSLWQIKKQPTGSPKRYLQAVLINFVLKRFILNPI